jgi:hypothetical protein
LLNKLSTLDYGIRYKKLATNGDAKALSRIPIELEDDEEQEDDAPVIINFIVVSSEQLHEQQRSDNNLAWLYALKQRASENQFKIEVNTFENREQQCYYKQWDRIHILTARSSNTTTIFIRAREDSYEHLKRLLNKNRFHEHGWEAQTSAFVFTEAAKVQCQSAACIECHNFNDRTPYRSYNKYSCRNAIDITDPRISAQSTTTPKISKATSSTISSSAISNSTPACSICLSPTTIADSVKPLLHKNNTTACKHTICLTFLNVNVVIA